MKSQMKMMSAGVDGNADAAELLDPASERRSCEVLMANRALIGNQCTFC